MTDPTKKYIRDYADHLRKYAADDDAFAGAIHDRPDDPAPHLVYADWLQEQGREDDEMGQRLLALSKSPDDEGLRDHVADHLEQRGRIDDADLVRRGRDLVRCQACTDFVNPDDIAHPHTHNTGGETQCMACHRDLLGDEWCGGCR